MSFHQFLEYSLNLQLFEMVFFVDTHQSLWLFFLLFLLISLNHQVKHDLMKSDFGEYGEVNKAWTADDVKGFTKILGNQMKIYYSVQNKNKK